MVLPFKWNLFSSTLTWYCYFLCSPNFLVCGWNPMVWPFNWNLFSSSFTWCYLFVCLFFSITIVSFGDKEPQPNCFPLGVLILIFPQASPFLSYDSSPPHQLNFSLENNLTSTFVSLAYESSKPFFFFVLRTEKRGHWSFSCWPTCFPCPQ